jgi:hypothetical protein
MSSDPPDNHDAGEIFHQSMKDALAHLDKVSGEVTRAREEAFDEKFAAQQELARIKQEAERISQQFIDEHRKQYDDRIRRDTLLEVTKKLMASGVSSTQIRQWLGIGPELISDAWFYLGFEVLLDRPANVTYEQEGRSGNVVFNWDGHVVKFWFEFGGANALAIIYVPEKDKWENETGIALDHRSTVLDFIARRVIRDQAPGYLFEITAGYINIYR